MTRLDALEVLWRYQDTPLARHFVPDKFHGIQLLGPARYEGHGPALISHNVWRQTNKIKRQTPLTALSPEPLNSVRSA